MSTRAERRKCPRKVQGRILPGEPTCLCVHGAVLGIPPDATLPGIDVIVEAIDARKSKVAPWNHFEKPISKLYVARFSRMGRLSSAATLWIDLPTGLSEEVHGAVSFHTGGPCGAFSLWQMRALAPDSVTNTIGFVLGELPRSAFAAAVTPF